MMAKIPMYMKDTDIIIIKKRNIFGAVFCRLFCMMNSDFFFKITM